jgi:hypothetical protein
LSQNSQTATANLHINLQPSTEFEAEMNNMFKRWNVPAKSSQTDAHRLIRDSAFQDGVESGPKNVQSVNLIVVAEYALGNAKNEGSRVGNSALMRLRKRLRMSKTGVRV